VRIGIDASNLRGGGGITHLAELLRHGDPGRHGITRVTLWGGRLVLQETSERPWLDRVHVPALDGPLPVRVAWQLFVRSRIAASTCDLVFAPGATPPGRFRPYVSMHRNMLPFADNELARVRFRRGWVRLRLLRSVQTHAFRRSAAVIFLTEFARDRIEPLVGATLNGHVIPHGVGERFLRAPRPARSLASCREDEPFRFVYVSSVDLYKHQWTVAAAVIALRREGLPVVLELIGDVAEPEAGRRLQRFRATLAEHERGAVCVGAAVPYDSLPGIYAHADAFVFASTCETLPMTLLEAMASGLPVAASDVRPMPDILGDAATYFDAMDVRSVTAALRRVAMDHDLRRASACRAFARASAYSWTRAADRTFDLLSATARRHRAT
jgi:glycosyltransferase involved in cell wall biosynthesis